MKSAKNVLKTNLYQNFVWFLNMMGLRLHQNCTTPQPIGELHGKYKAKKKMKNTGFSDKQYIP